MRRVALDREGGFMALDSIASGELVVVVDSFLPPLMTRARRRYRRSAMTAAFLLNLLAATVEGVLLVAALILARC